MVGVLLAKQIIVLIRSRHLFDALGLVHGHLVSVHVEGDVLPELGEGVKVNALAVDAHVGPGAGLGLDPVQGHEVDVAAAGQGLEQNVGAVVDVYLAQLELVGAALRLVVVAAVGDLAQAVQQMVSVISQFVPQESSMGCWISRYGQ